MSWIHDEYDKHSKKAKPIMDRANSIINDFDELYGIISNQGGADKFSELVTKLKNTISEYSHKRTMFVHYATSFNTTGYRISYSGSDPLRINAANEYNTRQMQHDQDESKKQTRAVVDADMALHDVERALKNVETFLSTKRLSAYYQKKEEEKRQKVLEEARAEAEKRQAEKLIKDKKKKVRIISLIITSCLTIVFFFIPVVGKLSLDNLFTAYGFPVFLMSFGMVYLIVWFFASAIAKTH